MIGYRLKMNHYVSHSLITTGLFLLLLFVYSIFGVYIALAFGASMFYWSRELAQWEIREATPFEWKDALVPKFVIFVIAILLTLFF
jgi:hypothetical protein